VVRALWLAARNFLEHQGLFMSAGLSFYLLICLIPILLVLTSMAGFLLSSEAAAQAVLNQLSGLVPVYRAEFAKVLSAIVQERRVTGLIGTATLILFATQLFGACRVVMNRAFGVARGRGWAHGMLHDLVMIVVMATLFLTSILVTDLFVWVWRVALGGAGMPRAWLGLLLTLLGLAANMTLFVLAYRYFPNRRVSARSALAGGLLTTALWEVAKEIFQWYVTSLDTFSYVYGPLAAAVALLMFTYYSAAVFILGGEFTAALEARARVRS
jgi:membrane protein